MKLRKEWSRKRTLGKERMATYIITTKRGKANEENQNEKRKADIKEFRERYGKRN